MLRIRHRELKVLELIGNGAFGDVYLAEHARLRLVVYKELYTKKLGDRYAQFVTFELDSINCDNWSHSYFIVSLVCVHIVECCTLCMCVFECLKHVG